jgi:hypothetical protein
MRHTPFNAMRCPTTAPCSIRCVIYARCYAQCAVNAALAGDHTHYGRDVGASDHRPLKRRPAGGNSGRVCVLCATIAAAALHQRKRWR